MLHAANTDLYNPLVPKAQNTFVSNNEYVYVVKIYYVLYNLNQ